MRIAALTDIHAELEQLANAAADLAAADQVLLSGDLTDFGRRDAIVRVIDAVRRHNPNILAVPGNCDRAEVGAWLDEEGINLHGRHRVRDGVCFVGLGGSLPCPDHTPNELTDERMGELLAAAIRGAPKGLPLVGLFHQPPYGTVNDRVVARHVGSRSIRTFIEEFQPLVCFTGHIHEGRGVDRIGKSCIANPGPLREGSWTVAEIAGADLVSCEIHGDRR